MPSPPTDLSHAPNPPPNQPLGAVEQISVDVHDSQDGSVPGIPTSPRPTQKAAAILLSGAGGGVAGPSAMYISINDKSISPSTGHSIPVLRLDFHHPACNRHCVVDMIAAMDYLERRFIIS